MCGRYYISIDEKELRDICDAAQRDAHGHDIKTGDIHPGNVAPVLAAQDGIIRAVPMKWDIPLPIWDKEAKQYTGKFRTGFNARDDMLDRVPTWRAVRHNHVLVPVSWFYEFYYPNGKSKGAKYELFKFEQSQSKVIYLAGLYAKGEAGGIDRFTIITTHANDSVRDYHDRMPVIVDSSQKSAWLQGESTGVILKRPQPKLTATKVVA